MPQDDIDSMARKFPEFARRLSAAAEAARVMSRACMALEAATEAYRVAHNAVQSFEPPPAERPLSAEEIAIHKILTRKVQAEGESLELDAARALDEMGK